MERTSTRRRGVSKAHSRAVERVWGNGLATTGAGYLFLRNPEAQSENHRVEARVPRSCSSRSSCLQRATWCVLFRQARAMAGRVRAAPNHPPGGSVDSSTLAGCCAGDSDEAEVTLGARVVLDVGARDVVQRLR